MILQLSRVTLEWGIYLTLITQWNKQRELSYRIILTIYILHIVHERFRLAYIKYKLSKKFNFSLFRPPKFLVIASQQSKYQKKGNSYIEIGKTRLY